MPHHFERVGSQQPVASSFNQTVCIAPQLFRDLVVRSCVSRFTVNKKAHHLCLVSLLTRKPHIKGIVQFPKRTRRRDAVSAGFGTARIRRLFSFFFSRQGTLHRDAEDMGVLSF